MVITDSFPRHMFLFSISSTIWFLMEIRGRGMVGQCFFGVFGDKSEIDLILV
jgi:hypothetical protein